MILTSVVDIITMSSGVEDPIAPLGGKGEGMTSSGLISAYTSLVLSDSDVSRNRIYW